MSTESELLIIRTEINLLRTLEHLVTTPEYRDVYNKISPEARELPLAYIRQRNVEALREWLRVQRMSELEDYGVRELRVMARDLKVADYHLQNKAELIRNIKKCRIVSL